MAKDRKSLAWAPKARRDLIDIWKYFAKVASHEIADDLLDEIDRAASRLRDRPYLGRLRNEIAPGLRSVLIPPHSIIYRVTDATIEISRVLHERRDFSAAFVEDDGQP